MVLGFSTEGHAWFGLAIVRRHHHLNPRNYHLADLAIEHGMGHRHACRRQYVFQWRLPANAVYGRAPPGN
jgi:hypothetical protein